MNKNTSVTIRMDSKIKEEAQGIFADLGMDMSTAINVFLKQTIRHRGFPFDLSLNTPNTVTAKAIQNASDGIDLHGPFSSIEALMEDLDAED